MKMPFRIICVLMTTSYFMTTGADNPALMTTSYFTTTDDPVGLLISNLKPYENTSSIYIICDVSPLFIIGNVELWKNGKIFATNDDILDQNLQNSTRADIVFKTHGLRLNLLRVRRYDTGTYQCLLNASESVSSANYTVYQSESQFVNVRYYPDPTCSPSAVIQKGKEATVTCNLHYNETNAPVDTQWTATSPAFNLTAISSTDITRLIGSVTSEFTFDTTESDINGELICEISNEFVAKNCSVPVRTIWPSLSVYPSEISANIGDEVMFTCALQFPINIEPTWQWDSTALINNSSVEYISSFESTLTIRELHAQDNGAIVSCFALLGDRWLHADAKLLVINNIDLTTPVISGGAAESASTTGWKTGFSIVFILMLIAIGAIVYLIWRFRPQQLRDLFPQSHQQDKTEEKSFKTEAKSEHNIKAGPQTNVTVPGENYMDLEKPRYSNTGNTGYTAGETYMDLQPPEDTFGEVRFPDKVGADTDEVYATEITSEPQADEIYDYADDEDEQVYTNQTVITPRFSKR